MGSYDGLYKREAQEAEYSTEDILKIQEWINNYPRRVLNGRVGEVVEECKN